MILSILINNEDDSEEYYHLHFPENSKQMSSKRALSFLPCRTNVRALLV